MSSVLWKFTAAQILVFDWIVGSSQVIALRDTEGVRTMAKFPRKFIPDALFLFFRDRLWESSCLFFAPEKIVKPHAE